MWWSKKDKEWYVQVTSDHERAMLRPDWWEGTEKVLSKGYDYSNRYGWFIIVGVPLKQYLKHYPEDVYLAQGVLDEIKKRDDRRRKEC
jgi:hypothetical protein